MTTQTQIQTQATSQVLTDEQLEALNGGGFWGTLGYQAGNVVTGGLFGLVDTATGGHLANEAYFN